MQDSSSVQMTHDESWWHRRSFDDFKLNLQAYAIAGGQHSVSVAAHRSEFQETALHYGGGMSAVIVLQSLVMVGQLGLDGYGVYEAIRLHRSGMSYVCGNLLPVFWVMFSLHIIQNCCNLVKFRKGDFVAKRSGRKGIEHNWAKFWQSDNCCEITFSLVGVTCPLSRFTTPSSQFRRSRSSW